MSLYYDSFNFNASCQFDVPFREGIGAVTYDVSKNHSIVTLVNTPTWSALGTGQPYLAFNGVNEYAEAQAADTGNLDFTNGAYSLGGWLYWSTSAQESKIVMGRYELDVSGWELYLTETGDYLSLRHHHAGGSGVRSSAYSQGWVADTWHHFIVSRAAGDQAAMYRNGKAVTTTSVLEDAETETRDLVIGVRYTKDSNFMSGGIGRLQAWSTDLGADDAIAIYELEKAGFA